MSEAKRCRLYDKAFVYVPAAETDVAKRFARIKREQARQVKSTPANVTALARKAKK